MQTGDAIPLTDDGNTHQVRVVLGEKAKSDSDEQETGAPREQQTSGS